MKKKKKKRLRVHEHCQEVPGNKLVCCCMYLLFFLGDNSELRTQN